MKIEETVEKYTAERETKTHVFVAYDGTRFDEEDECIEYEDAQRVVLRVRARQMAIKVTNGCELYNGEGFENNEAIVLVPKVKGDVELLRSLVMAYGTAPEPAKNMVPDGCIGEPMTVIFDSEYENCWIDSMKDIIAKGTNGQFTVVPAEKAK
jgi:hypothetical protein